MSVYDDIIPMFLPKDSDFDLSDCYYKEPHLEEVHLETFANGIYASNGHIMLILSTAIVSVDKVYNSKHEFLWPINKAKAIVNSLIVDRSTIQHITVSQLRSYLNKTKKIFKTQITGKEKCTVCNGSGEEMCSECNIEHNCPKCGGTGEIVHQVQTDDFECYDWNDYIPLVNKYFNPNYINIIADVAEKLNCIEMDISTSTKTHAVLFDITPGVKIVLMPMRS